jgi:hypothetical protein
MEVKWRRDFNAETVMNPETEAEDGELKSSRRF